MLTPHIITLILLGDLIQCHHQHVQQEIRHVYGQNIPFISSYSFPIKSLLKIISMQSLNVITWNRNAKTICLFRVLSISQHFETSQSSTKYLSSQSSSNISLWLFLSCILWDCYLSRVFCIPPMCIGVLWVNNSIWTLLDILQL